MRICSKFVRVLTWSVCLIAGSALAQGSLPLTSGKVLVDMIDLASNKKIRLPEGRWVVMGLHTSETPLTGSSKNSQTVENVSLMNEDEKAPVQYLVFSWSLNADVNWTAQPCDSYNTIKNRPFKDTISTNTSSLIVKCSASSFNLKFGDLNLTSNLNQAVQIRKSLWLPIAQHPRKKPSAVVDLFGYISKHRNDFVQWYAYVNPNFYGLDQSSDLQYSSPSGIRQIFANNLLKYAMVWNDKYIKEVEKDFFPSLFQSASVSVDKFNFSERVNPTMLAVASQTPPSSQSQPVNLPEHTDDFSAFNSHLPICQGDMNYWSNCFATHIRNDGVKFSGEYVDGKRNGKGISISSNGKYIGNFKNDKPNGQGTMYFHTSNQWKGDIYTGEWKDGIREGQATYFHLSDNQWKGDKYVGLYKDNERNGIGTYFYLADNHKKGDVYVGEWKNSLREGLGIEYRLDGSVIASGNWVGGKLASPIALDSNRFPFHTNMQTHAEALADRQRQEDELVAERRKLLVNLNDPALRSLPWKERLERAVQAELRQWLNADAAGLDEIPPPVYPAALSLKQEVWETNNEFEVRVEAARSERRSTIEGLQADYRTKVEQRNMRVAEYNKTRQNREAGLAKRREILIKTGLAILAPAVTLSDVAFDQRSGSLTISAQIDGLGLQVFAFKDAPQAFRRSALTDAGTMKAIPQFQVSTTGDISLLSLSVEAGGATVRGTPSVGVASSLQLASVILPAQVPALVQQGALTVDRNQVEQILYRDENEMLRKRLEDQRRQQEAALASAENRAAQEIARIRAEAQRVGVEVVRAPQALVQDAHALIIGNSAYRGSARLENPTRDAKAMSAKLRSMGFKVTELGNTNREQMVKGLSEFTRSASKADLTLLFYAGHGMQVQGVNYMIPVDMSLNDPSLATLQAVSLTQVVEQYMPGKTKLVFLDACRDNPIVLAGVRGASKGLAPINVSEGTLIAYATKDGQTAEDGVGQNSPFTQALLEHLADPFDIGVVLRKVREKVMKATGGKQQPWEYGSLTGGELVLSKIQGAR